MRIAIALKTYPPDVIGGMEIQTKQMATELYERGYNVMVSINSKTTHINLSLPGSTNFKYSNRNIPTAKL